MLSIASFIKGVFTGRTDSAKSKRSSKDSKGRSVRSSSKSSHNDVNDCSSTASTDRHTLVATVMRCYPHSSVRVRVQDETRAVSARRLVKASNYIAYHILKNLNDAVRRSRPPVYDLPAAVTAHGFTEMLDASDDMAAYLDAPHSEDRLFDLLITSHALSSVPVLSNIDTLLDRMWGHSGFPSRPRPLHQVLTLLFMAREHNFHKRRGSGKWVMTHALYELLANAELHKHWFFKEKRKIKKLDIAPEDMAVLEAVREPMRALWQEHLLRAPGTTTNERGEEVSECVSISRGSETSTRLRGFCGQPSENRIQWWKVDLEANGTPNREADVLRYSPVASRKFDMELGWCDECLREWEEDWERARVGWWREFHALVQQALREPTAD